MIYHSGDKEQPSHTSANPTCLWKPIFNLHVCWLTCVQIPNKPSLCPINSHVTKNVPQLHPIYSVKCVFITSKTNINLVIVFQVSLRLHRIAAVASLVPQPLLNPYWSRPKNNSALLSSLRTSIFSKISETCGIRLIVRKSMHSWALFFFWFGIIIDSRKSRGHSSLIIVKKLHNLKGFVRMIVATSHN